MTTRIRNLLSFAPSAVAVLALALAEASEPPRYELTGRIVDTDGNPLRGTAPNLTIQGTSSSFSASTRSDSNGHFKFKKLPTGMYILIVRIPRIGTVRRTIEVGPSLADKEGKVHTTVRFDRRLALRRGNIIPANQLSIPDEARAEYQKGLEHVGRQKTDRAIESFEKALSIAPHFSGAHYRLGDIAFRAGRYELAESYYRGALDHNPGMFMPRVNLGGTLLAQHKYAEALQVNREAEGMRPEDPLVQAQLGYCYFHLDRMDEAIVHLRKAKEADPSHFSFPQLLLAEIYKKRGNVELMIGELEEFIRLHPDSEQAADIRRLVDGLRSKLQPKS